MVGPGAVVRASRLTKRSACVALFFLFSDDSRRRARAARPRSGGRECAGKGIGADRSDGLLGFTRHGRLALAHGHAGQR